MKKSLLYVISAMLIVAFVLTACGPSKTPTATEAPTVAPTEVPTAAPIVPVGKLVIWADDTRAPILQDLADEVLATYQLELVVELKANLRDDFKVAAPVGEGPDILFGIPHDQLATLVDNGLLAPIDLGDKAADFSPIAVNACTFGGVLYCMPYATENLGFFYNTDLVTTPPTTWDELVTMGEALKAEGKVDYIMAIPGGLDYNLYPLWTSFGGYVFGKDDAGNWNPADLGLDSAGFIAGVQWLADQAAKGNVPTDADWANNHALFESGKAPFIMAGPWALNRIRESGVHYAIADFPSGPAGKGYPLAGTQGIVINAQSENALLAQAFLSEFVATDETMQKLVDVGQRPSAYLPVLEKSTDPDLQAMALYGEHATMMPAIPAMGAVWANWNSAIILALQAQQTADVSMKDAATKIRNMIANPLTGMFNVPGSYQAKAGCAADWDPSCTATAMTLGDDGMYHSGPFTIDAGDYEAKVALDGTWDTNYGMEGKAGGDNYKFTVAAGQTVEFMYDPTTHLLTITIK
jgi:maltose/maltodextrin transport system substrate-binding protein/arabinogalactan oligomer/maltooligosaccharide transport system substrate-binding protein